MQDAVQLANRELSSDRKGNEWFGPTIHIHRRYRLLLTDPNLLLENPEKVK
jgi:hypothetical protein